MQNVLPAVGAAQQQLGEPGGVAAAEEVAEELDVRQLALCHGKGHLHLAAALETAAAAVGVGGGAAVVPLPGGVAGGADGLDLRLVRGGEGQGMERLGSAEVFQQALPELRQRCALRHIGPQVGHAAGHGLDALGLDLVAIHLEGLGHRGQVGVEHDGAVVHDTALAHVLGVAGELLAVHSDVVAAGDLRLHAEGAQRFHDGDAEHMEVDAVHPVGVGDEREVQVAQVVIDRAAAGKAAHHGDVMGPDEVTVDLRHRVLIFADNDGVVVLPEHEVALAAVQAVEHILLQSQIPAGVGAGGVDIFHRIPHIFRAARDWRTASAMTRLPAALGCIPSS